MSTGYPQAKAGLGTGIVEALARHLQARIDVADSSPGTAITISDEGVAATRAAAV